jgi:hypothetical protein
MSPSDRIVAEVERVLTTDIKTNRNLSIQLVLGLGACIQRQSEGIARMERKKKRKWARPKWGLGFQAIV